MECHRDSYSSSYELRTQRYNGNEFETLLPIQNIVRYGIYTSHQYIDTHDLADQLDLRIAIILSDERCREEKGDTQHQSLITVEGVDAVHILSSQCLVLYHSRSDTYIRQKIKQGEHNTSQSHHTKILRCEQARQYSGNQDGHRQA